MAEIFVVSDRSLAELLPALNATFRRLAGPATAKGVKNFAAMPTPPQSSRIILINRPNSPQSYILGGVLTPARGQDDAIIDLTNANNALGGNFLARLNMNLRETKGWSYGVRGGPSINENAVAYQVAAPVQADRTGDALAELIRETSDFLGDNGVTAGRTDTDRHCRNRRIAGPVRNIAAAVLRAMQTNALFERGDDYYETLANRYRAQTQDSLDAAVRAAVDVNEFVWVIVGDAEKVRPQLDALGLPVEERGGIRKLNIETFKENTNVRSWNL